MKKIVCPIMSKGTEFVNCCEGFTCAWAEGDSDLSDEVPCCAITSAFYGEFGNLTVAIEELEGTLDDRLKELSKEVCNVSMNV